MSILIRMAEDRDLEQVSSIENECFPKAEAASYQSLKERLAAFKTSFLVAEEDGVVIGFINGCITQKRKLIDELYESTHLHDEAAPNQMVFGLAVQPEEQKRGIASQLMKAYIAQAARYHKALITLTCKKRLIPFYEHFGYRCEGKSASVHGGVCWYDMTLFLEQEGMHDEQEKNGLL